MPTTDVTTTRASTALATRGNGSALRRVREAVRRLLAPDAPAARSPVKLPPSPFTEWQYKDAVDAVTEATDERSLDGQRTMQAVVAAIMPGTSAFRDPRGVVSQSAINRAFFEGDHWQLGAGWVGPHPQLGDTDYDTAMNELVAAFTSKNVIKEIVKRHANGVVGKPLAWSFVPRRQLAPNESPNEAEAAAIAEANSLMQNWWMAKRVRPLLHDALCTLLLTSRSPLRIYIPPGLLGANGTPDAVARTSIADALSMIYPEHPQPESAAVVRDNDTMLEAGIRLYTEAEDDGDVGGVRTPREVERAQLVYLDQTGRTVTRLLGAGDESRASRSEQQGAVPEATDVVDPYVHDFGARLPMMELHRDPLITPQVCQQQRALNLALSMLPRNIITGGFLERVLLNAQMPGRYTTDGNGVETFIPDPLFFGPSTTNFFAGLETRNPDGTTSRATPTITYRDPVPVDAPVKAASEHYLAILDEVSQLHIVLSGEAFVSGKSREQARAEFIDSLFETKPEAESAAAFFLETPLAMAEAIAGTPGRLTGLVRVEVSARLSGGPLDAIERTANEASIGKTLSQETAMARNGVDDVDAELTRMQQDPLARAAMLKAQGEALTAATAAGITITTAATLLGMDAKTVKMIADDVAANTGFGPDGEPAANGKTPAGNDGAVRGAKPLASGAPDAQRTTNSAASHAGGDA